MPYRKRKFYQKANKTTILLFEKLRTAILGIDPTLRERTTENFVEYGIGHVPFCLLKFPKTEILVFVHAERILPEFTVREIGLLRYSFLHRRPAQLDWAVSVIRQSYNLAKNKAASGQLPSGEPLISDENEPPGESSPWERINDLSPTEHASALLPGNTILKIETGTEEAFLFGDPATPEASLVLRRILASGVVTDSQLSTVGDFLTALPPEQRGPVTYLEYSAFIDTLLEFYPIDFPEQKNLSEKN